MTIEAKLVVLEGRWWDAYNTRLNGAFDLLTEYVYDSSDLYYYEHFCDARSLTAILNRVGRWPSTFLLYVGAHGDPHHIQGSLLDDEGRVSPRQLKDALLSLEDGYHGLFLSSCAFLTEENARILLAAEGSRRPGIRWVAGYTKDVHFMDSTALELVFLTDLLTRYRDGGAHAWVNHLKESWGATQGKMGGLIEKLGLRVYRRNQRTGEVVALGDSGDLEGTPGAVE
jgi:hypothetical protein